MSFSSPAKTVTHSANARLVVTTVARRSYRSVIRLKSSSPPTRSKGTKPELVDDEDVDAEEPLLQPRELAGIARFEQLPHQIGRPGEEHASFLLRRFHAERNREVRFAGADRTGEDQILGRGDPFAAREGVDLRRADAVGGGEIKGVERLHLREARLARAAGGSRTRAARPAPR